MLAYCKGRNDSDCDPSSFRGTMEARFVYVFVLGILFSGTKDLLRSQIVTADAKLKSRGLWEIYSGLVLLMSLLFRAHNLPVLCCCLLIQTLMAQFIWKKLHYDAAQTTIMHYWFGQAFFYFQVSHTDKVSERTVCNMMYKPAVLVGSLCHKANKIYARGCTVTQKYQNILCLLVQQFTGWPKDPFQ